MKPHTIAVVVLGALLPTASVGETLAPTTPTASGQEVDLRPLNRSSSFEMRLTFRQIAPDGLPLDGMSTAGAPTGGKVSFGLGFSHWLEDDLAVTLAVAAQSGERELVWDAEREEFIQSGGLVSLLLGLRKYVWGTPKVRPYLAAAVGPYFGGSSVTAGETSGRAPTESRARVTLGGLVGGGVALRLGRSWMVDLGGGYTLTSDFSRPVSGRDNYNGFEVGIGIRWLFGGGGEPRPE
jgi:hypothetical protein